jgi:holo-[acyl-carrier protein] synthase
MILGIGSDLCDIRRIEKTLDRYGTRFKNRIFTHVECKKSDAQERKAASYAKRFAAKEACAKALGAGMRFGVSWKEMGVVNSPSGKPDLFLQGGAAKRLDDLTPKGHRAILHLTITDDFPWAQAFVIIEARPKT